MWSSQSFCALKEITGTTTQCSPRCAPWVAPHSASQALHGRWECARVSDRLPHKLIAQSSQWNLPCSCVGNQHGSSTPTKLAASAHVATMEHYHARGMYSVRCAIESAGHVVVTRCSEASIRARAIDPAHAEWVSIASGYVHLPCPSLHLHVWHQRATAPSRVAPESTMSATSEAALMPEGIYPVMLTPFTASSVNSDGDPAVDHPCLAALSEWYIRSVRQRGTA